MTINALFNALYFRNEHAEQHVVLSGLNFTTFSTYIPLQTEDNILASTGITTAIMYAVTNSFKSESRERHLYAKLSDEQVSEPLISDGREEK